MKSNGKGSEKHEDGPRDGQKRTTYVPTEAEEPGKLMTQDEIEAEDARRAEELEKWAKGE